MAVFFWEAKSICQLNMLREKAKWFGWAWLGLGFGGVGVVGFGFRVGF